MVGLNIGCGPNVIPGYTNIDRRAIPEHNVQEVDIRGGLPFEEGAFDIVYSSHCLEHFYWYELKGTILPEIMRVLKTGGTLRLALPDIKKTADQYEGHPMLLPGIIFGGGTWVEAPIDHDTHHFGWDYHTLMGMFKALKMEDIREWKSEEYPELADVKDAAATCPITVNIEGKKPVGWSWEEAYPNFL
jgi:predicted SAM-dependent methyltransferase